MLFRLFPRDPDAGPRAPGGPLYVPRALQGGGRHDNPERYGSLYASRARPAVVAEFLRARGLRRVEPGDLLSEWGRPYAIAAFEDPPLTGILDLDEPRILLDLGLRPSGVATRDREATQVTAVAAWEDGFAGLAWWSTIEASWINVTLFAERAVGMLELTGEPEPLTIDHPALLEAAEVVGVELA